MRFLRFRKYLREALSATEADVVAYEEVRRHMGTHAAHVYGALWGALVAELDQEGKPYRGIPVATVKRCATGKGNANKQAMVAAFERRVGELPEDDNEADALFIALALHNEIGADDS